MGAFNGNKKWMVKKMNKGILKIYLRDGNAVEFSEYTDKKLDELMGILNGKYKFLKITLYNKKQVVLNKDNVINMMFEPKRKG